MKSIILGGLLALAVAPLSWADRCAERKAIQEVIPAAGLTELRLNALAGSLDISASRDDQIRITGMACTDESQYLERMGLDIESSGSIVEVTVIIPYNDRDWRADYAHIDLTVEVPAQLINLIRDSSGDLEATGVNLARVDDSSGNIRLRATSGNLDLRDSSGDVSIRGHRGTLVLDDSSGDLEISEIEGDVRIKRDSSGDIEIGSVSGFVNIDRDSSGDIEIEDIGESVTVASDGSGSIRLRDIKGSVEIGSDGSGDIRVQSIEGDFTVSSKGSGDIRSRNVRGRISIPQ